MIDARGCTMTCISVLLEYFGITASDTHSTIWGTWPCCQYRNISKFNISTVSKKLHANWDHPAVCMIRKSLARRDGKYKYNNGQNPQNEPDRGRTRCRGR